MNTSVQQIAEDVLKRGEEVGKTTLRLLRALMRKVIGVEEMHPTGAERASLWSELTNSKPAIAVGIKIHFWSLHPNSTKDQYGGQNGSCRLAETSRLLITGL